MLAGRRTLWVVAEDWFFRLHYLALACALADGATRCLVLNNEDRAALAYFAHTAADTITVMPEPRTGR